MESIQYVNKKPSTELVRLIREALVQVKSFFETWDEIKVKADTEGFTEDELREIIKPMLPESWDKHQRYYFFNRERRLDDKRKTYKEDNEKSRNVATDLLKRVKELETEHMSLKEENKVMKSNIANSKDDYDFETKMRLEISGNELYVPVRITCYPSAKEAEIEVLYNKWKINQ